MQRGEFTKKRPVRDASRLKIGIVVAKFNRDITDNLLAGALEACAEWKVKAKNIEVVHVPGGYELPLGALRLIKKKRFHCILVIGCILKGETKHDEYISHAVAQGIMQLMLQYGVPISFGVITPNTLEQARARSQGPANHAALAARAALEMALDVN